MRVLITGSRAPVALELARAFGEAGHTVYTADPLPCTVGSSSRFVAGHIATPAPRGQARAFGAALLAAVERHGVDLIIPTSEEVFALAASHAALAERARVLAMPLGSLRPLHHKYEFQQRCAALGIPTPRTRLLRSAADVAEALPDFPEYVLKPAFSRFATSIITNCGPPANDRPPASCQPTLDQPWLIQSFAHGASVCSYSVLHAGRVTAHCAYAVPYRLGLSSGVQFASVDGGPTLALVERLGAALGYTGQISLDWICGEVGPLALECNPRATSGLHLLDHAALVRAMTDPAAPAHVVPPGRVRQLALAMLTTGAVPLRRWPDLVRQLALVPDVVFRRDDWLPVLGQMVSVAAFAGVALRRGVGLVEATTADIEWNGEELL